MKWFDSNPFQSLIFYLGMTIVLPFSGFPDIATIFWWVLCTSMLILVLWDKYKERKND